MAGNSRQTLFFAVLIRAVTNSTQTQFLRLTSLAKLLNSFPLTLSKVSTLRNTKILLQVLFLPMRPGLPLTPWASNTFLAALSRVAKLILMTPPAFTNGF